MNLDQLKQFIKSYGVEEGVVTFKDIGKGYYKRMTKEIVLPMFLFKTELVNER